MNIIPVPVNLLLPSDEGSGKFCVSACTTGVCCCRRNIVLLCVLAHRPVCGKLRRKRGHAFADLSDPPARNALVIALIKFRDDFVFEDLIERLGIRSIPSWIVAVFVSVADGPSHVGGV